MKPHQFSRVLLHVRFELNRFQSALLKLEACEFPSGIAQTLLKEQQSASQAASRDLDQIEGDFEDDPDGAADRLISEFRKMMSRRRNLEVLEKARSDEVPWSLVPSVESLAKQLLPNHDILITTTPDMNYMVGWNTKSATIYLPRLHRANGFLHVLIGHELFHPIVTDFIEEEKRNCKKRLRDLCRNFLQQTGLPDDLFFPRRLDDLLGHATLQWEKALTELMCDMGAVAIFGPAALWSLSGFAATQEMNSPPTRQFQYYPPWRMRIRVVLDFLRHLNANTLLETLSESLKAAGLQAHAEVLKYSLDVESVNFDSNDLAKDDPLRDLSRQVYELVEECLPRGAVYVTSKVSPFPMRWSETLNEIPILLKSLALLVPPSELIDSQKQVSKAASMTGIVMACWIERLQLENSQQLDLSTFRRLCRLMLKAIEDAQLKRSFCDWSEES